MLSDAPVRLTHAEFDRLLLDFASLVAAMKDKEDMIMRAMLDSETGARYRKRVIDSRVPGLGKVAQAAAMIAPMVDEKSSEKDKRDAAEAFIKMLGAQGKGAH